MMENGKLYWFPIFLLALLRVDYSAWAEDYFSDRKDLYSRIVDCNDKGDVTEWNKWRNANTTEVIELRGANLSRMKLNGINLSKANLEDANLMGANLQEAKLDRARFTGANLSRANLKRISAVNARFGGVDLTDTIVENAWLQKASFGDASICRTNFKGAYLEGADLTEATIHETELTNAILRNADLRRAKIIGTNLTCANLEYANLRSARLTQTNMTAANLQNAELTTGFIDCELQDANLSGSILRGCLFDGTNIKGADFRMSMMDDFTRFLDCRFDESTDFRGVGLGNIRISESDRIFLERNIRKMNWEEWYNDHKLQKLFVQPFWWISDYGYSTWRIIIVFAISTIFFAFIYGIKGKAFLEGIFSSGIEFKPAWRYRLVRIFRPLYFSVVTMTTLGLGDIRSNPKSVFGHIFIIFQVVWGYILLGAIITRLGILFTSGGPGL
jgi:uncharacterized protein YjbI with pentapeptide repeats